MMFFARKEDEWKYYSGDYTICERKGYESNQTTRTCQIKYELLLLIDIHT